MQKYMINGSTGADVRSFLPRFIIPPVYDNLNDAKQHAINLVTKDLHKFEKIETGFEIKTNDLSWEIIDKDGVIWEHVYIQKIAQWTDIIKMKLWTKQPVTVAQKLKTDNVYYADPTNLNVMSHVDHNFKVAYHWMFSQYRRKCRPPRQNITPIWWYVYNYSNRPRFNYAPGDDFCCIIIADVSADQLLLSNFEYWHFPLNDWWIHPTEEKTTAEWDCVERQYDLLPKDQRQQLKYQSWQQVFNIDLSRHTQAISWQINADDVIKIIYSKQ